MKVDILGIKIDQITAKAVLDKIEKFLESDNSHYIVTANPEIIMTAQKDREFRKIINKADIVVADGIGLLWASKFLSIVKSNKNILPERITGIDLIYKIARRFQNSNYSIFFLGGENDVAESAAKKLKQEFSNLKIAGADSSVVIRREDNFCYGERFKRAIRQFHKSIRFFTLFKTDDSIISNFHRIAEPISTGFVRNSHNGNVIKKINQTKPSILFVAFGAPKQEKWIAENLKKIPSVKLVIGVGGAFDFIVGKFRRAPKIVQRVGLEWFWRFILEPRRVKRIFTAVPMFAWAVLKFRIKK